MQRAARGTCNGSHIRRHISESTDKAYEYQQRLNKWIKAETEAAAEAVPVQFPSQVGFAVADGVKVGIEIPVGVGGAGARLMLTAASVHN